MPNTQDCVKTNIRGKTTTLQQLYIRGNQIVFCIVPNMLRNAPMFARIKQWRKYKGHPPVLASEGAKGQRAAIIRKGQIVKDWPVLSARLPLLYYPPSMCEYCCIVNGPRPARCFVRKQSTGFVTVVRER